MVGIFCRQNNLIMTTLIIDKVLNKLLWSVDGNASNDQEDYNKDQFKFILASTPIEAIEIMNRDKIDYSDFKLCLVQKVESFFDLPESDQPNA